MSQPSTRIQIPGIKQHISINAALAVIVILAATVFPRLMVIGGLPMTDDGYYAYNAQAIHASLAAGKGLPDMGKLMIYPLLVSWVFELTSNHFILLRAVDLFVAATASLFLYRVVESESGSRVGGALISLAFLFIMNQPTFVFWGFKNSMFAAYVPLFLAMRVEQGATSDTRGAWWWVAGALASLAVLLRETFLPFLIVGVLSVLIAYGRRACLRFVLGAAVAGLLVILGILAARDSSVSALIGAYRGVSSFYGAVSNQRVQLINTEGALAAREAAVGLMLGGMGIVTVVSSHFVRNRPTNLRRFAFWLSVTLVPLLEPTLKIGYAYHFAVCLPGLAGLAALGWRTAETGSGTSKKKLRLATIAATLGVLILLHKINYLVNSWPNTRNALQSMGTGTWPNDDVAKSNYLLAAEAIRKAAPPNGTLSVSGLMEGLYPLTGMLPRSNNLSNLSSALLSVNLDGMRFKQSLMACPPDVLMTTTFNFLPGEDILAKAVKDSGLYEPVAIIPVGPRAYGAFGGTVYRRINPAQIQSPCNSGKAR